jgi:cell division protein FtsN
MTSPKRPPARRTAPTSRLARKSGAGGTLLGLFIGIALGLSLAAGVAFYLMKSGNPYQPATASREPAREAAKTAKAEPGAAEKPRFDFYKILPGNEEPKAPPKATEKAVPDKATLERAMSPDKSVERTIASKDERPAADASRAPKSADRFWLQAGSFAAQPDAENMKARLALAGWEAEVQSATLPDKGVRYRVRLGPYDNTDELNRIKGELGKRGFDVAVIKY